MTHFFEKTTLESLLPRANFDDDLNMDSVPHGTSGLLTSFDTNDAASSQPSSFLSRILPTNNMTVNNTQTQNQNNVNSTSDDDESIDSMLDFTEDSQSNSNVVDTKTENNQNNTSNTNNNTNTETAPPPEKRMTEAALEALLKNPKSIHAEQFQSTPSYKAVCSALTEKQGPILKFSEIFGPLADPFVPSKKRKVTFAKDKPEDEGKDRPSLTEEEIWAEYDSADDNEMSDDNNDMQIQDEDTVGQPLVTDPSKKLTESVEHFVPLSASEAFSLVAQHHWEEGIVWSDNALDSDIDMSSIQQDLFAKAPPSVTAPPPKPRASTVKHWGEINTAPAPEPAPAETKPGLPAMPVKPLVSSLPPPLPAGPLGMTSVTSPPPLFRSPSQPDLKKIVPMPSLMRMPSSASIAKMPMKPNPRLKTPLNDELEEGSWAETIIWDDKKPPAKPPLTELIIDFNDTGVFPENPEKLKMFEITSTQGQAESKTKKRKLEETGEEELDRFNISNDSFYKSLNRANKTPEKFGKSKILHSEPAWKLNLVKTHLVDKDLEDFHHPKMTVPLDETQKLQLVTNEAVYESSQSQSRSEAMRKKGDLSAKDGRIVLMEYVEERPPTLMNVGMGTKVKNFYRKRNTNENPLLRFDDGENMLLDPTEKSPFVLGDVNPGQTVQALDNNMFVAPVFRHTVPETDFLVVRQGKKFYLREIPAIYTVGQQQPRMEVYQPNSRPANDFVKKRLQAYIHRMFMKNSTLQVKISDIMTLFPGNSETAIRKRLKDCADFQRGGGDTGSWVVTDQSKLPNEDDLRRNVPPEHVCLYESMLAGMYYLREAGITRFTTTSPQFTAALQQIDSEGNEILKRAAHRLEEELLLSPWNLTGNFRMYTEKKGLLQLSGLGDPSGRGEGFSYLRMPMKNNQQSKKKKELQKQQVTGTDADLRKLSLDNARKVLLHFGVSESEIARLGRWERIALVRKKSSEVAASGEGGLTKFARGSRYSMHQQQLQYKEQEQMIWENQIRALSDPAPDLSDEEDEEEMEDFEKDLESMLDTASKKRKRVEQRERYEEAEKEEYEKFAQELKGEKGPASSAPQPGTYVPASLDSTSNAKKYLKRKVVVKNPDGTKSEKIEWITDPEQVEAILKAEREKIKNRRLPRAIPSQMTPEEAEERKKLHREKRRLQEQLRRLRQNQQKQEALVESIYAGAVNPEDRRIPSLVKCTKCGQHGHNRTNHSCPLYNEKENVKESKKDRLQPLSKDSMSGSKEGLILRIKKQEVGRGSSKEDLEANYLSQQMSGKNAKRRRRDPQVEFCNMLEKLLERIKTIPSALPFLKPVARNDKWAPDYHKIIKHPIDLSTIRQRLTKLVYYRSRGDFLRDIKLMKDNCYTYNEHRNPHLLPMVDQLYSECEVYFQENDEELAQLEREIAEGADEAPQTPRSFSNPTSPQMSPPTDWLHAHRPTTPSQMSPPMSPGVAMSPPGAMSPAADSQSAMSPSQFLNHDTEEGEIDIV